MIFIGNSTQSYTFLGEYEVASRSLIPITDAGGAAGQLMLCISFFNDSPGANYLGSTPSGWTAISTNYNNNNTGRGQGISTYAKVLDGSETSSVNFMAAGADFYYTYALRYSGVTNGTPTGFDIAFESTGAGVPSSQTVNASGQTTPLIVIGAASEMGSLGQITLTMTNDNTYSYYNGADGAFIGHKVYNSSPSNVTVSVNDVGGGRECLNSFYFRMV